ncbi:DUF167 domain-containing protein [Herbaspirillum sp. GCM10030257]|uniref:DUF167 domain-containing protein n=1 Tax=Herbaspirillum sp. GCM10030257 TaxID=3273393 RepID=UPI00361002E4
MKEWCAPMPGGVRITVQVQPNAKKSEVVGVHLDALKIRLQAQPIEGKANDALVKHLADTLGCPKNRVTITHGHTSRRKSVELVGVTPEEVQRLLTSA